MFRRRLKREWEQECKGGGEGEKEEREREMEEREGEGGKINEHTRLKLSSAVAGILNKCQKIKENLLMTDPSSFEWFLFVFPLKQLHEMKTKKSG